MKYVYVNKKTKTVTEIFSYNPFEWIVNADGVPNEEFLADCRALEDDVEIDINWIEQPDGSYRPFELLLEDLRAAKKREIGDACENTIYAGIEVGGKHYSLNEHDQIELLAQQGAVKSGAVAVPYHADGELCRIYPADEFTPIADVANYWILYNRTRCNHINTWIARAEGEELENITYSSDLPEDLQKHMDELLKNTGVSGV